MNIILKSMSRPCLIRFVLLLLVFCSSQLLAASQLTVVTFSFNNPSKVYGSIDALITSSANAKLYRECIPDQTNFYQRSDTRAMVNASEDQNRIIALWARGPDYTSLDVMECYYHSYDGTALTEADFEITSLSVSDIDGNDITQATAAEFVIWIEDADDDDGDGMPYVFEEDNGLDDTDPGDAGLDPDNDGLTNLEEYNNSTKAQESDTDNDGLNDGVEVKTLNTDPANSDSDGDGLPDNYEVQHVFLNPLNNTDAAKDLDNDGLTTLQEYQNETDPKNEDSDNDGIPDGWEVNYNLNPLASNASEDSDGDGYTNMEEYEVGTDPSSKNDIPIPRGGGWKFALPLLLQK